MAGDRGRDLKFGLVSDLDRFDVDEAARQLDKVADAADDTGDRLDRLEDDAKAAGRALTDGLGQDVRDTARRLDDLGDDARRLDLEDKLGDDATRAARKVDDAFDRIARSSRSSAGKVDDSTDKMKDGLDDVGDEASQTAREMGASFGGSADDIVDAFQELGANAAAGFGPVGVAAGVAASVGVGLIRAEAEKLQQEVSDMVAAMIEAGGQLSEEAIDSKLQEMAQDGTLETLRDQARQAGVSFVDLARAHAGDADALRRVNDALFDSSDEMNRNVREGKIGTQQAYNQKNAIDEVARGLQHQTKVQGLAREATASYAETTKQAGGTARTQAHVAGAAWDDLRANMGRPINAKVTVTGPTKSQLRGIRAGILGEIGTLVVPVKPGQTKYSNTADNAKYRWG